MAVAPTPPARIPSANAATCRATGFGWCPYSRSSWPIGAFWSDVPGGTTSATGAKLTLTPACRSCRAQVVARVSSCDGSSLPCTTADGIVENPGPDRPWMRPPSWLAPIRNGTPFVAVVVAVAWIASETVRIAATPLVLRLYQALPKC